MGVFRKIIHCVTRKNARLSHSKSSSAQACRRERIVQSAQMQQVLSGTGLDIEKMSPLKWTNRRRDEFTRTG